VNLVHFWPFIFIILIFILLSGTNKSGSFKVFNNSINVLKKNISFVFSKPILKNINEKEKLKKVISWTYPIITFL
jgi:hypothetical protein